MQLEIDIWPIVAERLTNLDGNCNSYYMNHNLGIVRGLIWGMTGEDPGVFDDAGEVLKYFPGRYHIVGENWYENELYENGVKK